MIILAISIEGNTCNHAMETITVTIAISLTTSNDFFSGFPQMCLYVLMDDIHKHQTLYNTYML